MPSEKPNVDFLERLDATVRNAVAAGKRLVLVTGGGKTSRHYVDAVKQIHDIENDDLDWLGIHATRLNGHMLRTIFRDIAYRRVVKDPKRVPRAKRHKLIIAAGWKPGASSDRVAAYIANRIGVKRVVNMSNIDHVYSADPRENPDATPYSKLSWDEFRKLVGDTWDPNMSAPFDPIASKYCQKKGIEVNIISGDTENLEKLLRGEEWIGTTLS